MSWFDTALAAWYRSKEQERAINAQGIEQAGQSLTQGLQQARQDKIANQVANSGIYAPRAAAVNPGSIPAGVPTGGTPPMTGGLLGLQLRNQMANAGIENALKRAQMGYYGAHGAATLQNAVTNEGYRRMQEAQIGQNMATGGPQSARAQAQAQRDALIQARKDAEANADTIPRVFKDLKDIYGADAEQWMQAAQAGAFTRGKIQGNQWITDPNGPVISASQTLQQPPSNKSEGFLGMGANPGSYSADDASPHAPIDAIQPFADRVAKITAGHGRYVPPVVMPAQAPGPATPAQAPSGGHVPTIRTIEEYNALPVGVPYRDPNGVYHPTKKGGGQQPGQPQQAQAQDQDMGQKPPPDLGATSRDAFQNVDPETQARMRALGVAPQ